MICYSLLLSLFLKRLIFFLDWTDTWNSPETVEKRQNATKKLWEEEEEKERNGSNITIKGKKKLVYVNDIPDWVTFVTSRKLGNVKL